MAKKTTYLLRTPLLLAVTLAILCPCSIKAEELGPTDASTLGKLEDKFFQHAYPKDDPENRLDRLEKLVFGDSKTGTITTRITALKQTVPNLDSSSPAANEAETAQAQTESTPSTKSKHKSKSHSTQSEQSETPPTANTPATLTDDVLGELDKTNYPAVTAMEKKVLGKDYIGDPVTQRLTRLETKVFGKPSTSTDLSERVDRLKQGTGIDIARTAPAGSDWTDEDEDDVTPAPPAVSSGGEDGSSFSGKDVRSDMQRAFGMPSRSYQPGPSGAYGMGNYSSSDSDSSSNDRGFATPARTSGRNPYASGPGLNQQVSSLETEIFTKTYPHDPLPARLNRLEATVFPNQKPSVDLPLPDRVQHLLAAVPISQQSDYSQDPNQNSSHKSGQPHSTLGKLGNSISNFLNGGPTGSYSMQSGAIAVDPQTGMLIDQMTGNVIDPNTGAVIGTRSVSPYSRGLGNYGSFGSFGNGFSPMGMPYGMGSGMQFGFGRGGIGF